MWWLLACLALAAAWLIASRVLSYQRLFAARHLMEFAQALPALKQTAMGKILTASDWGERSPDDAPILRTSAGLVLVYTISIDPHGRYTHHASVSIPGRVTAHAVGEMFILLWARLLGVEYGRLLLQTSPSTVHHAEFVLDNSEQSAFAQRPVEAPTADMLKAFEAECLRVRQNLRRTPRPAAIGL